MDDVAMLVGNNLHFDVPGMVKIFFYINFSTAEVTCPFSLSPCQSLFHFLFLTHNAQTSATTTGTSLNGNGVTIFFTKLTYFFDCSDWICCAWYDGHACFFHHSS